MNAQYTHRLKEEARAALADNADKATAGNSGLFAVMPEGDREFRTRERIRREIVREHFGGDSRDVVSPKPALVARLARLLRLS